MFTGHVDALREIRPPQWLVHLVRRQQADVPYQSAIRAVLILAVPLAVGLALGHPEIGSLVSTGGVPVVMADNAAAYRRRLFRLSASVGFGAIGYVIGALVHDAGAWTSVVLVLLALVSVPIGYATRSAGPVGMLLLVHGVIGSAEYFSGMPLLGQLAAYFGGVCWGLLVGLSGWLVRPTAPERRAVAQVFTTLSVVLGSDDPAVARAARQQLTLDMNTAYDRLLKAYSWIPRRHSVYTALLTRLTAATALIEACTATVAAGEKVPKSIVDYVVQVAAAIRAQTPLPAPPPRGADDSVHLAALHDGIRRLRSGDERAPTTLPSVWRRLADQLDDVSFDGAMANAAVRLGLCVVLAEIVGAFFPLYHIHWVTLTVAIVFRPELGSVFGRAVLRAAGTFGGVLLAAIILPVNPPGWLLVVIAVVCAASVPIGRAVNYGLLSVAMTLLIIVQLDLQNLGDLDVLIERIVHTIGGALIVLVAGYWLWPQSLRPNVGAKASAALDAVRHYLAAALAESTVDGPDREREIARRKAYRALSDLRSTLSQVIIEPSTMGRQALAWWPVVIGLERLVDAVTEVVVRKRNGTDSIDKVQVNGLLDAMDELRDAVREGREPVAIGLPSGGELTDVVDQLQAVVDGVRGPSV